MGEKFNSGSGGYICDNCRVLLWVGRNGKNEPRNRMYVYSATPETIRETTDRVYCSDKCRDAACPHCSKNKSEPPHSCPYKSDINNDSETLCTCCSDCQRECAEDI